MKRVVLILVFIILFASGLSAQTYRQYKGDVEAIDMDEDGSAIRFQVTFAANKASDNNHKITAEKTALCALLFNGIEGINNNEKLVQRENDIFFENFFGGKKNASPYLRFIKGVQQAGAPQKKDNGEFQIVYYVEVKYKALVNEMQLHKLSDVNATIVRIPARKATQFN